MFKLYQKNWHSINFRDLNIDLSKKQLPNDIFYKRFYKAFSDKYKKLDKLDPNWLKLKSVSADKVAFLLKDSKDRSILSIGAGLGLIEKKLFEKGYRNIFIQEVSEDAASYSRTFLNPSNIYLGNFPECVESKKIFDYVLLGGIEYIFDDLQFGELLENIKKFIHKDSKLIILSWSIEKEDYFSKFKIFLKELLIKIQLLNPGQFWGYSRTLKELVSLLIKSGFNVEKAEIDESINPWVTGCLICK